MRVHIGSDHAGYELKEHLRQHLGEAGHHVIDHGPEAYDGDDDYPTYCLRTGECVAAEPGSLGIVVGGSGNGEQIAANKVRGVRAALAWNAETAELARLHNDANVVSIGARMHSPGRGDRDRRRVRVDRLHRRDPPLAPYRHAHLVREVGQAAAPARRGVAVPEGHTLYRLAADIRESFKGDRVSVSSPQGRFASSATLVDGSTVLDAQSHGKHLFVELGAGMAIHVHLGLYGTFTIGAGVPPPPIGQVRLRLVGPRAYGDLRGATACDLVDEQAQQALVDRLGPDPLRPDADWERMWHAMSRSRRSVAALLMDQSVVAGIGNVYRAELLYRAGLDPRLRATGCRGAP
jgi:endonuclease-8